MGTPIRLEDVMRELNLRGGVSFYSCNQLFGSTWLASHVYFVEMEPGDHRISDELLLVHALSRHQEASRDVNSWIGSCFLVPGSPDSLRALIAHALSDVSEGAREDHKLVNSLLRGALEGANYQAATGIYHLSHDSEAITATAGYEYGPTYRAIWRSSGRFYLLEIHNES
jgi:hypothetical protein